ncbi:MAG: ABC transporter ATP-binding protein [Christensenellales bacterium]
MAGTWKKILRYAKKWVPAFVIALVFAIGGTVLTLIGPSKIKELTNIISTGLFTGIDMSAVAEIAVLLVVLYGFGWLFSVIQHWIMSSVTQRVSYKLRDDISHKINRLPMGYYHKTSTGDVLSRVTNDVDTLGQSLNNSIGTFVSAVTLFVGSLTMMLVTNPLMALTAVAATIIGFSLMLLIMRRSQKYFTRMQENLGALDGHIEETFSGHTIIKAYNGENKVIEEFKKLNGDLRDSAFRAQSLSDLMQPLMSFVGNFAYVAVCIVGAALTIKGKADISVIIAFTMYIRLFTQPLSQIAQSVQSLQSAAAAGDRVFEFLEAKEMSDESEKTAKLENVRGAVRFDHVKFAYDDADKPVIKDFSAEAKPGQKIAIVGPTGAGKTTLVNLLMRFYEINGGDIRLDGVSTKSVRREEVHRQFCMVLQDTWLFEGTVRENLVYNTDGVSDEKIAKACNAVGLDNFIKALPKGYDTVLTEQISLSQGQKQQLTIARAMIADKPLLILDEATSSIDTRTEIQIQNAMDELMKNRTSFVIAHRLSTIKNADLILVIKEGDIIESGTHEQLLAKDGFYAELYNSQFDTAA